MMDMEDVLRGMNIPVSLDGKERKTFTPPKISEIQAASAATDEVKNNKITEYLAKANIPKRFKPSTFELLDNHGVPKWCKDEYEQVKGYARNFKANKEKGYGIIFSGSVGTMKTTLAVACLQSVISQGYRGYFVSMPELLDILFSSEKQDRREFEKSVKSVGLLVIDDMGAEYGTDWVVNKVDSIITHRYNELLPTIITTNLTKEEMKGRYMERVYDRLKQTSLMFSGTSDSLRTSPKVVTR